MRRTFVGRNVRTVTDGRLHIEGSDKKVSFLSEGGLEIYHTLELHARHGIPDNPQDLSVSAHDSLGRLIMYFFISTIEKSWQDD